MTACASPRPAWTNAEPVHSVPVAGRERAGGNAPATVTLPIGAGLSASPSTVLAGATLDIPLDDNLTFGPSLIYGTDSDVDLFTGTLQMKYFLPSLGDEEGFAVRPFLSAGAGFANIDKSGRASDHGALFHAGAGLRFLTGKHYRIGSEARLNMMPDKVAGERAFVTIEVLQVVLSF
jgi:hypothetical protein